MDAEEQLLIDIDRYLRHEMSESERAAFDERLNTDDKLRNRVQEFRQLDSSFDSDLWQFKKRLNAVQEDLEKEIFFSGSVNTETSLPKSEKGEAEAATAPQVEPGQVIRMRYVWAAAASVILIIGAFWFFNHHPDMQQLAMNAAKDDFSRTRDRLNELDSLFVAGDYKNFLRQANKALNDSSGKGNAIDLEVDIARAYIFIHEPQEATKFLQSLSQADQQNCGVKYALALSRIALSQKEEALNLLKSIEGEKCYPFDEKAKILLNKMN